VCGDTPTPYAYRRIADDLRRRIEAGELGPGDVLPSEATLVEQYGVARGTARQAFTDLNRAGFIEIRRGRDVSCGDVPRRRSHVRGRPGVSV
jgi:DNA-binding GntR family transcriptional regulator